MLRNYTIYTLFLLLLVATIGCDGDGNNSDDQGIEVSIPDSIVYRVRNTDRLYTTEYVVNKVVAYDDIVRMRGKVMSQELDMKISAGPRKALIPIEGRFKAYVDFREFSEENVHVSEDGAHITITLPDPKVELTSTKVDQAGIKTFVGFWRSKFSYAELAELEQQGREAIINAAANMDIVSKARLHAYEYLLPIVEAMGYAPDQVTIDFSDGAYHDDYINKILRNQKD